GEINSLVTPPISLLGLTSPVFTFDLAHSLNHLGANEKLKVFYSFDCGQTWTLRYSKSGAGLSTVGSTIQPGFEPSQASHWRTESVALNSTFARDNVRFKFEATSGMGNSVFIDNLKIGGVLATNELTS